MRQRLLLLFTLLTVISFGQDLKPETISRTNPVGDYSVTTTINIKSDNRFAYEFSGHMIHGKAEGSYQANANNHVLILTYDIAPKNDINYRNTMDMAPKAFKYRQNRLYEMRDYGRPIKRAKIVSRHRRFFIVGNFWKRKNVSLKRVRKEMPTAKSADN